MFSIETNQCLCESFFATISIDQYVEKITLENLKGEIKSKLWRNHRIQFKLLIPRVSFVKKNLSFASLHSFSFNCLHVT